MNFWVKGVLGGAVVAVPTSAITMAVYRESIFGSSSSSSVEIPKESSSSNSQSGCYVIPITESSNQAKLLICKGQDTLNSGENTEYFLYNKDGQKKKTKATTIKKKERELEITLGGEETQERKTLSIKEKDWAEITTELDLKDACNLLVYQENQGGTKWQCSNGLGGKTKEIKLETFYE